MIDTEGARSEGLVESDFQRSIKAQTPLGRIGQTDDISPAAVFLASRDSKYMTGETLFFSGGLR